MEKSQLAATRASTNPWVAPAESARTRMGWVTRAGMVAVEVAGLVLLGQSRQGPRGGGLMWSSASLAPARPGRSMAARGSPVVSHHTPNGKNPKPNL